MKNGDREVPCHYCGKWVSLDDDPVVYSKKDNVHYHCCQRCYNIFGGVTGLRRISADYYAAQPKAK